MGETLDSLGVALCLFDDRPATLLWNHSFLDLFPEHAGHVHVGELYSENLRRFYKVRLDASEMVHIERHIEDGVARHTLQRLPFVFEHRGSWLRVASLPVPEVGRVRIWTRVAGPDALDTMRDTLSRVVPEGDMVPAIEDVADGLMLRSRNGVIRAVNRRFMLLYRLEATNDVQGRTFEEVLAQLWGDSPSLQSALLALADNQRFEGSPYDIPLPGDRWVRVSEQPSRDGALVSTHADITELRRLQQQADHARLRAESINKVLVEQISERERAEAALRQVQRMEAIGQITGGIAHDFGNLLSVVMVNLEMLAAREIDPVRSRRLAVARSAAERGSVLTSQLLAFARQQPLQPAPTDLNGLLQGMVPLLRSALGARIELVLQPAEDARRALVDPTQLELVVLNLAINARDAMPDGGRLCVGTSNEDLLTQDGPDQPVPGPYVRIFVTDTGTGMTPEVLEKAFEPFFTTKQTGSGLGLSQTYGLARQSGGIARIRSVLGQGTSVEVVLPGLSREAAGAGAPTVRADRPVTILVVDDNLEVRDTTALLLERLGYATMRAAHGGEALERLQGSEKIDLVLSDVSMPVMTGPQLAARARAMRPRLPIILFSGYADPEGLAEAPEDCPLLRKPVRSRELAAAISKALADGA